MTDKQIESGIKVVKALELIYGELYEINVRDIFRILEAMLEAGKERINE